MGFKVYKKDVIKFEVDGHKIEFDIMRMSAKQNMLFAMKAKRLDEEFGNESSNESASELIELYCDMLSQIVVDVRGLDDAEWPEDHDERYNILQACGVNFVSAAITAYNEATTKEVDSKK